MAIVAQAQFWKWRELKAEKFQGWQGGAKCSVRRADIYRGLEAACAGWGHLGPGRVACGGRIWTGSLVIRSEASRDKEKKSVGVESEDTGAGNRNQGCGQRRVAGD